MISTKIIDFEEKLKSIFGHQAEIVKALHSKPFSKAFRIENGYETKEILKTLEQENFQVETVPFENCYYIPENSKNLELSKSTPHLSGQIYIQELSSMLPPILLERSLKDKDAQNLLDLCAAPGSKAGQLIQLLKTNERIFVNEPNRKRFFKLQSVLSKYGEGKFEFLSYDGVMLPFKRPGFNNFFDGILADVPCSNEGSIRLDNEENLKYWSKKEAKKISKLQKGLLNAGLKMLKPGGILVYSTCTYSVEENEAVIDWALRKWKDQIEVIEIKLPIKNTMSGFVEFEKFNFDPSLSKTVRIVPDGIWKGFYLSIIRKKYRR